MGCKILAPASIAGQAKKVFFVFLILLIIYTVITGIVIFFMFLSIPCTFWTCHPNATCINHRFRAECVCKYGYGGNGIDYCDECGVTRYENNLRVVGGIPAVPHSWPSAVFLSISYKTLVYLDGDEVLISTSYMCGGSLIDRRTVLTAAHCIIEDFTYYYNNRTYVINITDNEFYPTKGSMFKVYVGADRYIQRDRDIKPAKVVGVERAFRHEKYNDEYFLNDIGILKLDKEVELNEYVQIACLPDPKTKVYPTKTNISAYALGWGILDFELQTFPNSLQNVIITIYNGSLCENTTFGMHPNWDSQICAGEYEGGKDTCQGDSGSPIFVLDTVMNKFKYIQVGIVSYGQGCAWQYLPGIYTRTSYFMDWIKKNTR